MEKKSDENKKKFEEKIEKMKQLALDKEQSKIIAEKLLAYISDSK